MISSTIGGWGRRCRSWSCCKREECYAWLCVTCMFTIRTFPLISREERVMLNIWMFKLQRAVLSWLCNAIDQNLAFWFKAIWRFSYLFNPIVHCVIHEPEFCFSSFLLPFPVCTSHESHLNLFVSKFGKWCYLRSVHPAAAAQVFWNGALPVPSRLH